MEEKPHHDPAGGFRNPWETAPPPGHVGFLRWLRAHRSTKPKPIDPDASALPRATPDFPAPLAGPRELVVTWVGHCTFLIQIGGMNVLTDPIWSTRAGPAGMLGPKRWVQPGIAFDALPPIDVVLISHNHYDHLDGRTVRRLAKRNPAARWLAPLGLGEYLRSRDARAVTELDWWSQAVVGPLTFGCTPAQHYSARTPGDRWKSLWCGWTIASAERRVYFSGDSAWFPELATIGRRFGPFDLIFLPIGAYEPRSYMRYVHMNPEEAVRAHAAISAGSPGTVPPVLVGMHWGTFKLTDEAMDEPPRLAVEEWRAAGNDPGRLWVLAIGETRRLLAREQPMA